MILPGFAGSGLDPGLTGAPLFGGGINDTGRDLTHRTAERRALIGGGGIDCVFPWRAMTDRYREAGHDDAFRRIGR
ncbi:hypothetical protein BV509_02365 [Rhodovulum sulfidophilum]|nr:hypothetical protein BV509_02365 [Rhodovulum sulfidophilum]